MDKMKTVEQNGQRFVMVPVEEYQRIMEALEDAADVKAYDAAVKRGEEAFPVDLFDRIDSGENGVRVFREYRGLTLKQLGGLAGVSEAYLSQIESGKRKGDRVLRKIAKALNVDVELLD